MAQDETDDTTTEPAPDADERPDENRSAPEPATKKQAARKRSARKQPARKQAAKRQPVKKQTSADSSPARPAAATAEPARRRGAGAIAREAAAQLHELTGHQVEGITAVHRDDDGWMVEVDLLELRRIPATTDVLATYVVEVDDEGNLMGYRRRHRFVRGSAGGDHR